MNRCVKIHAYFIRNATNRRNKKMIYGKGKKSLLENVKKIDAQTSATSVIASGETVNISVCYRNGKLSEWTVLPSGKQMKGYFRKTCGTKYSTLESALEKIESVSPCHDFSVMALVDILTEKVWQDDKGCECACTKWAVADSLELGDTAELELVELWLDEAELKACLETMIAFYDDATGDLYPLMKEALPSLGNLFGSQVLFKRTGGVYMTIAAALMLQERLSSRLMYNSETQEEKRGLRIHYRNDCGSIRPISGITVGRGAQPMRLKVLESIWDALNRTGITELVEWQIGDAIMVSFSMMSCIVRISIPKGNSGTVHATAWKSITDEDTGKKTEILIAENRISAKESVIPQKADALVAPVVEAISEFSGIIGILEENEAELSEDMLSEIFQILGKKRTALCVSPKMASGYAKSPVRGRLAMEKFSFTPLPRGKKRGVELLMGVMKATSFRMSEDRNARLGKAYMNLARSLAEKPVREGGEAC